MESIGNRYMLDQPLKRMANGLLFRGTDLTLKREVLLYSFREDDDSARQEALRWLGKASRLSDEHYMHILDVGSEDGTLFAVLQTETGGVLSDRLGDLNLTGRQALLHVLELSKGIREARRERLLECAVDSDNVWIDGNGRLRIINYWAEGVNGRRSVPGLALLLYQLVAKTDVPTSSVGAYSFELNRAFADLPDDKREHAVSTACKAYEGVCTLADFQQQLETVLGQGGARKESLRAPVAPAYDKMAPAIPRAERVSNARINSEKPTDAGHKAADAGIKRPAPIPTDSGKAPKDLRKVFREPFQLRKWHLFATAGFGVLILLLWMGLRPGTNEANGAMPKATPKPSATATSSEAANQTASPKPSQSETATAKPTATPTKSTAPSSMSADDSVQTQAGVMPDLVGRTKEDAEKLAIAAGLHYQYFLESNTAGKGIVFKQDLDPGKPVKKGDHITFWISKGN